MIAATFCERLKEAIKNDYRSLSQIARDAGYNESYIRRLLNGKRVNPTLFFVENMAGTLKCRTSWLLGLDNEIS